MSAPRGWHFGVTCSGCHRWFHVAEDRSRGDKVVKMTGPGAVLRIRCPLCGWTGGYAPEAIESRRDENPPAGDA